MEESTERWLSVKGFEDAYEVSSLGQVRSLDRVVLSNNRWGPINKHLRGKILMQRVDDYGYLVVMLSRNGKQRPYRVHRLVGEAFFGPRPQGMDTLHGPEGRLVNTIKNLRYGTRAENEQDKIRDGTFRHGGGHTGEESSHHKLTWVIVREIRRRHAAGERNSDLAREFGTSSTTIYCIVRNKQWKTEHDPGQ